MQSIVLNTKAAIQGIKQKYNNNFGITRFIKISILMTIIRENALAGNLTVIVPFFSVK
jgi:hypothetical protein